MNKTLALRHSLLVAALMSLPLAHAATLAKPDYTAAKTRLSADYKAAKAACDPMAANAKDICVAEAKAVEKVARAELEYSYTGMPKDQNKIMVAKAESTYAVAKEKCDDMKGNEKDVCVKQAKAVEVKALADAKMGKQITEAKTDAAQDKRDADYKVAAEKCDAMTGEPKASCVAAAKLKFGKS
jgi:hypothetical protein